MIADAALPLNEIMHAAVNGWPFGQRTRYVCALSSLSRHWFPVASTQTQCMHVLYFALFRVGGSFSSFLLTPTKANEHWKHCFFFALWFWLLVSVTNHNSETILGFFISDQRKSMSSVMIAPSFPMGNLPTESKKRETVLSRQNDPKNEQHLKN